MSNDSAKDFMLELKNGIIDQMIENMAEGRSPHDEMISSFLCTIFADEKDIEFVKAIGLSKFGDNREACLAINDFCGFLADLLGEGKAHMNR